MPLPPTTLPTKMITVEGTDVTIRSLSRLDAVKFQDFERRHAEDEAEVFIVASAFQVSEDEAKAWLTSASPLVADEVLEAILDLSGIREVVKRAEAREKADEDPKD